MIVDGDELRSIKRGLRTHIHIPRASERCPHHPGDVLRLRTGKRDPGVLVTLVDVRSEDDETGDWKLMFRRGDLREHRRLLTYTGRAHGDYTEDPALAMRGEPEAVADEWLERFSREARSRDLKGEGAELRGRRARLEAEVRDMLARPRSLQEDQQLQRALAALAAIGGRVQKIEGDGVL